MKLKSKAEDTKTAIRRERRMTKLSAANMKQPEKWRMITTEETEGKESPPTSSGRDSRHSTRIGAADSPECPDCDQEYTVYHVSNECQRGEEMRRRLGGSDNAHIIRHPRDLQRLLRRMGRTFVDSIASVNAS